MTRTLEIPAELENALQEKARRLGLPVESYVIEVLRHEAEPNGASAQTEHRQRVQALRGKYKKSGSMVDELLRDRRDEVARDEAQI
ncbi:MAG: hypothetical protein ABI210_12080 [Abditibacteriaceae bacterium]